MKSKLFLLLYYILNNNINTERLHESIEQKPIPRINDSDFNVGFFSIQRIRHLHDCGKNKDHSKNCF